MCAQVSSAAQTPRPHFLAARPRGTKFPISLSKMVALWAAVTGVTAGIDLTLAFVESDIGRSAALAVARHLVVFAKRPGGQAQFSAALALGSRTHLVRAEDVADGGRQFLLFGDFGVGGKDQAAVAKAMKDYVEALKFTPDGLFLVGDNFYGAFPEGLDSPRWKTGFEDMYPAATFPDTSCKIGAEFDSTGNDPRRIDAR